MEQIQELGRLQWRVGAGPEDAYHPVMALDLALVDAGIRAGYFGLSAPDAPETDRFETLAEARLVATMADDTLSHDMAALGLGRKSKLALLRSEADGSVRGLRNAVISIGHWFDMEHVPPEGAAPLAGGGYGESWRAGLADLLPEIMQLSVDGPLERMGLEGRGSVPQRDPVPAAFGDHGAPTADARGLSDEGRAFLAELLAEDEPESFVFASEPHEVEADQGRSDPARAEEEVLFVESRYAALNGPLFDGDAGWRPWEDAAEQDPQAPHRPAGEAHDAPGHAHPGHDPHHPWFFDGQFI